MALRTPPSWLQNGSHPAENDRLTTKAIWQTTGIVNPTDLQITQNGGGSAATSTSVNNAGWATTYPVITITGPIINPIIGSTTQGNYITVQGSYANTDTIVVDLAQRLVTINGSSARNLVSGGSNWFWAQPGVNQFYLSGTGTLTGTTSATVTWFNAYV